MAPGLVGPEKAARGKTPTDVWWHTIVGTNSREKTGYATQKPLGVIERLVRVHSNPGDLIVDFFAGSGTTGGGGSEAWAGLSAGGQQPGGGEGDGASAAGVRGGGDWERGCG